MSAQKLPMVENLEGRLLLAAVAHVYNDNIFLDDEQMLHIEGTRRDDRIVIGIDSGNSRLLNVTINRRVMLLSREDFTKWQVNGNRGNDRIALDESQGVINRLRDIRGQEGNDTVIGGTLSDTIDGGDGDDWIDAMAGDDTITSGDGNDYILGNTGNDTIDAGLGDDTVYGGKGADEIDANGGADLVYGGFGSDYIQGGDDNDTLFGNEDNDTIFGEGGVDLTYDGPGHDLLHP